MISFAGDTFHSRSRYDLLTPTLKHVKLDTDKEDGLKYASFIQSLNSSDKRCLSMNRLKIHSDDSDIKTDLFPNEHNLDLITNKQSETTSNKNEQLKVNNELKEYNLNGKRPIIIKIASRKEIREEKSSLKFKTNDNLLNLEQVKYKEMAHIMAAKQSKVEKLLQGFEMKTSNGPTEDHAKQDSIARTNKFESKKSKKIFNEHDVKKKHKNDKDLTTTIECQTKNDEKVKEVNMRREFIQKMITDQRIQKNAMNREEFLSRYHTLNKIAKTEEFQHSLLHYMKSATRQKVKESHLENQLNELKKIYKKKHLSIDETRRTLFEVQKKNNDLLRATTMSCQNTEEQLKQQLRKEEEQIARVMFEKEEKLQTLKKIKMEFNGDKFFMYQQIKQD
ncbi:centrosomal protein of 131 kDa isoform X9 [Hydra vulgaris]|uniref:Centrosomal protein of 131 kDa isoform X9 n=2 Tax=Hydra vulgaris TaxID=6087 RepID=A0ABM4BTV7_HYDVU